MAISRLPEAAKGRCFDFLPMDFNLNRFLSAQERSYSQTLAELRAGEKRSHWIWYIFPQLKGLGHSYNSNYYGIGGKGEAVAYLDHPVLGQRLREASEAVLGVEGRDIVSIMSPVDALKLKSSMTLFDAVSPGDVFAEVLEKYYAGERDELTLRMLESW